MSGWTAVQAAGKAHTDLVCISQRQGGAESTEGEPRESLTGSFQTESLEQEISRQSHPHRPAGTTLSISTVFICFEVKMGQGRRGEHKLLVSISSF